MRRDLLAAKSRQRETDSQIKDLKDRIVSIEKENDKLKDANKALKKEAKEMKQDLDLKNKQSFRIIQNDRDEIEEKLRAEIQLRVRNMFEIYSRNKMHRLGLKNGLY